jgi:hypothetical protein
MKVRALKQFARPGHSYEVGDVADFPDDVAKQLINAKYAEAVVDAPAIVDPLPAPIDQPAVGDVNEAPPQEQAQ